MKNIGKIVGTKFKMDESTSPYIKDYIGMLVTPFLDKFFTNFINKTLYNIRANLISIYENFDNISKKELEEVLKRNHHLGLNSKLVYKIEDDTDLSSFGELKSTKIVSQNGEPITVNIFETRHGKVYFINTKSEAWEKDVGNNQNIISLLGIETDEVIMCKILWLSFLLLTISTKCGVSPSYGAHQTD